MYFITFNFVTGNPQKFLLSVQWDEETTLIFDSYDEAAAVSYHWTKWAVGYDEGDL